LAALLVLGLGVWWNFFLASRPPRAHYVTDSTAQRSLALSDGSVMDIDVNSDLFVQFNKEERRVTLNRGQAYFQAAHNPARPFIVAAGDVSVRAVGTAFRVKLAPNMVDVLVQEGNVELGNNGAPLVSTPGVSLPLICAGEHAQMARVGRIAQPSVEKCDAQTISAMLTWQNPMTSFTDVSLRDVVDRFNRCNVKKLVLEDADLGVRKIGGTIDLSQVDAFVRLLEQDGDIVAEQLSTGQIGLRHVR
jgi:transmembrane sensor